MSPDHLARSGVRRRVEAVGEKEVLTDGTRVVHPGHVTLADNIARLGLGVDQILALHVRKVPMSELNRMVGR